MANIDRLTKGTRLAHRTRHLTVVSVFRAPRALIEGSPLPPFAAVRWDGEDSHAFINLTDLEGSAYVNA